VTGETPAVAAVILHREGRVLLQHRDDRPGVLFPGAWALFGGHLEPGEEPEAAARREIEEELGFRLEGPLPLFHHAVYPDRERFFFCAALTLAPEQLTLSEGQGMALVGPDQLDGLEIPAYQRPILERFFAGDGARGAP